MNEVVSRLKNSPVALRALPFVLFISLTWAQGQFGEAGRYWFYFGKTLAGAAMLAVIWRHVAELKWAFSWEAVVAGVGVFALWVGLDGLYPPLDVLLEKAGLGGGSGDAPADPPWNPHAFFGQGSALAWLMIVGRTLGSTFVVPPLEELFYRSFLYRYLAAKDFLGMPLNQLRPGAFIATAVLFGISHFEWIAGILCGFIYHGLVLRKNRLGDAMTAHAITNFLLALWVVWRGAWNFW